MNARLVSILKVFYLEEHHLLKDDLCERALVFRIGYRLTNAFQDFHVYSEYNRAHSGDRTHYKSIPEKIHTFPDIVVFTNKNDPYPNKIIIEAKKNNNKDWEWDKKKLHYFTDMNYRYRYLLGCHLILEKNKFYMVFYQDGNPVSVGKYTYRNNRWQDEEATFPMNYTYESYRSIKDLERVLNPNRGNP